MANPDAPVYEPSWASLAKSVSVEDVFKVHIDLRRPHVLPEAMLQIRLDTTSADPQAISPSDGPYKLADDDKEGDLHFVANPRYAFSSENHPSEIVERYFATSEDAISALRRGDIDVIDYLFPDDAARLRKRRVIAGRSLRPADDPRAGSQLQEPVYRQSDISASAAVRHQSAGDSRGGGTGK